MPPATLVTAGRTPWSRQERVPRRRPSLPADFPGHRDHHHGDRHLFGLLAAERCLSGEPSGEPSAVGIGPHEALPDVRYMRFNCYLATRDNAERQRLPRSHRGSALLSTPPLHAKVPFQRCALRHLTHMPKSARLPCAYPFTRRNSHSGSLDLAGDFRERPFPIITMENQVAESTWGDRACSSSPPALRMRGSAVQLPHKVPAGTRGLERDSAAWGGVADSLYECGVGGSGFAGQAGIGRAGFSTRLSRGGFWRLPRCGWRRRAWRMCSPGACGRCRVRARAGGRSPG